MNRATVVYLGMIAAFVAGLWAVLAAGGHLAAPEDLSGRWVAVAPPAGGQPRGPWPAVRVDQSGRYFELAFDDGPTVKVTADAAPAADGQLSMARGPWRVTVGPPRAGVRTFQVDGPTPGTFVGHHERPAPAAAPAAH